MEHGSSRLPSSGLSEEDREVVSDSGIGSGEEPREDDGNWATVDPNVPFHRGFGVDHDSFFDSCSVAGGKQQSTKNGLVLLEAGKGGGNARQRCTRGLGARDVGARERQGGGVGRHQPGGKGTIYDEGDPAVASLRGVDRRQGVSGDKRHLVVTKRYNSKVDWGAVGSEGATHCDGGLAPRKTGEKGRRGRVRRRARQSANGTTPRRVARNRVAVPNAINLEENAWVGKTAIDTARALRNAGGRMEDDGGKVWMHRKTLKFL